VGSVNGANGGDHPADRAKRARESDAEATGRIGATSWTGPDQSVRDAPTSAQPTERERLVIELARVQLARYLVELGCTLTEFDVAYQRPRPANTTERLPKLSGQ
jgi:hypothetical protein